MCQIHRANCNMQHSEIVSSKIQIGSIAVIVYSIIIVIVGVVIGLMSVYCNYQKTLLQYQMIGLFKRCDLKSFTYLTTSQKHFHCNNRWHCVDNNINNCVLVQNLLSTMRINMPVMMLGMYSIFFYILSH